MQQAQHLGQQDLQQPEFFSSSSGLNQYLGGVPGQQVGQPDGQSAQQQIGYGSYMQNGSATTAGRFQPISGGGDFNGAFGPTTFQTSISQRHGSNLPMNNGLQYGTANLMNNVGNSTWGVSLPQGASSGLGGQMWSNNSASDSTGKSSGMDYGLKGTSVTDSTMSSSVGVTSYSTNMLQEVSASFLPPTPNLAFQNNLGFPVMPQQGPLDDDGNTGNGVKKGGPQAASKSGKSRKRGSSGRARGGVRNKNKAAAAAAAAAAAGGGQQGAGKSQTQNKSNSNAGGKAKGSNNKGGGRGKGGGNNKPSSRGRGGGSSGGGRGKGGRGSGKQGYQPVKPSA